jgi:stage III sporulation protein AA
LIFFFKKKLTIIFLSLSLSFLKQRRTTDETTDDEKVHKIGKMSENVNARSSLSSSSDKNDGDVVIQDDLTEMLSIVPEDVREKISKHKHRSKLLEIVLDLGRQPEARFSGMEDMKKQSETLRDAVVTQEELDHAERVVGEFGGDNRAGVTGTLHRISCIRNRSGKIIGLTCRVGRAVTGHVDMIADVLKRDSGESVLFLGKPGVGKTTVIREIARVLSDDLQKRVVIIDTSNEIGGDGDIPHPAIGSARRMQVPDPSEQHKIMIEAVENHTPEIIIVDEIGTEMEALACRTIAERGVQLIGTAHGRLLENLIKNPTLSDLVGGVTTVTLGDDEARSRGCQKTISERAAPATFPIVVEMHARSMWVEHDVEVSVDDILVGNRPVVNLRTRDEERRVQVFPCVYDMDLVANESMDEQESSGTNGNFRPNPQPGFAVSKTTSGRDVSELTRIGEYNNNNSRSNNNRRGGSSNNSRYGGGSSIDDPYAWAQSLGTVPDKDALNALLFENNNNNTNGKKQKKVKKNLGAR